MCVLSRWHTSHYDRNVGCSWGRQARARQLRPLCITLVEDQISSSSRENILIKKRPDVLPTALTTSPLSFFSSLPFKCKWFSHKPHCTGHLKSSVDSASGPVVLSYPSLPLTSLSFSQLPYCCFWPCFQFPLRSSLSVSLLDSLTPSSQVIDFIDLRFGLPAFPTSITCVTLYQQTHWHCYSCQLVSHTHAHNNNNKFLRWLWAALRVSPGWMGMVVSYLKKGDTKFQLCPQCLVSPMIFPILQRKKIGRPILTFLLEFIYRLGSLIFYFPLHLVEKILQLFFFQVCWDHINCFIQ